MSLRSYSGVPETDLVVFAEARGPLLSLRLISASQGFRDVYF